MGRTDGHIGITRPHLEFQLRQRLLQESNIELRTKSSRQNYIATPDRTRVCGVEFSAHNTTQTLNADLVVDCTGRYSRTIRWLEQQGFGPVPVEEMDLDVSYSTQLVRFADPPPWRFIYVGTAPPDGKRRRNPYQDRK